MSSFQSVPFVEPGIIPGLLIGYIVFSGLIAGVMKASAYDLFHLAIMDVNTGSEFHAFLLTVSRSTDVRRSGRSGMPPAASPDL